MPAYGKYHRNESDTQTAEDAAEQVASGEMWGRVPRNGILPTVQAYTHVGIRQARRIEFSTEIKPRLSPFEARWCLGDDGVEQRQKSGENYACIKVTINANFQV